MNWVSERERDRQVRNTHAQPHTLYTHLALGPYLIDIILAVSVLCTILTFFFFLSIHVFPTSFQTIGSAFFSDKFRVI